MKHLVVLLLSLFAIIGLEAKFNKRYDSSEDYDALGVQKRDKRGADGLPDDIPADVRQQLKMQMEANKMMKEGKDKLTGDKPGKGGPGKKPYSTQMGGPCAFSCPNGRSHPLPSKPNHKPKYDGCGITGMPVSGMNWNEPGYDFRQCCNLHDKCYNRCNNQKEDCDSAFKECMFKWCKVAYGPDQKQQLGGDPEMLGKCEKKAQVVHTTTTMVGCTQYKAGQEDACDCGPEPKSKYYDDDDNEEDEGSEEDHDEF